MKEFILLALNIILTIGLLYYAFDESKEYLSVGSQLECIDFPAAGKSLCAQCISRTPQLDSSKGFIVSSTQEYAGLKFPEKQEFISCKESLHLVDYSNALGFAVLFERQQMIGQLFEQLQVSPIFSKTGKYIIQPKYDSFIIFGWYDNSAKKGADISFPNDHTKLILGLFFYVLNAAVLIIILGKLLIKQNENKIANYFMLFLVAGLELIATQYLAAETEYVLSFVRVIALTLALLRVEVRAFYVFAYSAVGILMVLHPLTLSVYAYLGWLLVLIGGWEKLSVESIWRYLMFSQFIVAVNYLIWYLVYQYEADTACRILELSQLVMNLVAFAFLGDQKVQKFKEYVPTEQKAIYLSGYDEEEEMVVRT